MNQAANVGKTGQSAQATEEATAVIGRANDAHSSNSTVMLVTSRKALLRKDQNFLTIPMPQNRHPGSLRSPPPKISIQQVPRGQTLSGPPRGEGPLSDAAWPSSSALPLGMLSQVHDSRIRFGLLAALGAGLGSVMVIWDIRVRGWTKRTYTGCSG